MWDKWENGDANRPNSAPWKEAVEIKGVVSKQMKHTLKNFFVKHMDKVVEEKRLGTREQALQWAEEERVRLKRTVSEAIKYP